MGEVLALLVCSADIAPGWCSQQVYSPRAIRKAPGAAGRGRPSNVRGLGPTVIATIQLR